MANHNGKGYIFINNLYKGKNDASLLDHNKKNMEGKAAVQSKGKKLNKKEQTTTKKLETHKIHANNINANFVHSKDDKMYATENHLHYSVKAMLEFL